MPIVSRQRVILAKIESVYGTDPTPTGTANAMLIANLSIAPMNATIAQREVIKNYKGISDQLIADAHATCEFEVEIAGAGTVGIAPAYGPLLRACGFGQTLTTAALGITRSSSTATATLVSHGLAIGDVVRVAGASETEYNGDVTVLTVPTADTFTYAVTGSPATPATGSPVLSRTAVFAPVSQSEESVTIYYMADGIQHKVTGCMGSVEFTLNVKQVPVMKFNFMGIYNSPTDVSLPTTDFSAFTRPKVPNTTNTPTFSFFSHSGYLESFTANINNQVEYRNLIGTEYVMIVDRKPSGTLVIEAPLIATKDYFTIARAGTTGALSLVHGTSNGNKVTLAAPAASLGSPEYQDSQGVQMLSLPFNLTPSTGNDEFTLTVA